MMKNDKISIILGKDDPSTLGLIRSLGENRVPVFLLLIGKKGTIARFSKYIKKVFFCGLSASEITEKLIDIYDQLNLTYKPLILPGCDYAVKVLDDNLNRLKNYYIYANINNIQSSISAMMNKALMIEHALANNINAPKSLLVNCTLDQAVVISNKLCYPCIVKPSDSVSGGKELIKKCEDYITLQQYFQELENLGYNGKLLIQEYVHGQENLMIDLMGISLNNGEIYLPGFFEKIRQYSNLERADNCDGNVSLALLTNKTYGVDLENLKNYIKSLSYIGPFDIEYKVVDGVPFFIEINFRFGGPVYMYTKNIVNLPYIYYLDAYDINVIPYLKQVNKESISIVEQRDFKNVVDGNITFKRWLQDFLRAEARMLFNIKDPLPVLGYMLKVPIKIIDALFKKFEKENK